MVVDIKDEAGGEATGVPPVAVAAPTGPELILGEGRVLDIRTRFSHIVEKFRGGDVATVDHRGALFSSQGLHGGRACSQELREWLESTTQSEDPFVDVCSAGIHRGDEFPLHLHNTVPRERRERAPCFTEADFNCEPHAVNSIAIRTFRSGAWGKFTVTSPWARDLWTREFSEEDRVLISRRMSHVLRHARGNDGYKRDNGDWFNMEVIANAIDWRRVRCMDGLSGHAEEE
jgi:hypothetical protein